MRTVTIIDYGVSNILSLARAIEHCGAKARLTEAIGEIKDAQFLILPGVGAFNHGMKELGKRGLVQAIREYIDEGRPFMGVCLGMQMMLESSNEFGKWDGIGIIKGDVVPLPEKSEGEAINKIPHIMWNSIEPPNSSKDGAIWKDSILKDIAPDSFVYFVHSYYASPSNTEDVTAVTSFYGHLFPSVIQKGNAFGVQFHPEKSGEVGLKIIKNFISL